MAALNQRGWDLLRQMRHKLFEEKLISEDEYTYLLAEVKGSVKRLEDYDRAVAALQPAAAQPQRESEQPDWNHIIVWELRPETSKGRGDQICLERRDGFKGRRWAITKRGFVLNKLGEWEYEPIPSSRTEEWLETVRWETPEAARAALSPQTDSRYSPHGNYCSICDLHDKWCAHISPPQTDSLSNQQGGPQHG
jgi:hypothetical protein